MAQVIHEIRTGVYQSSVKLAGIEAGWAKLAPFGESVPEETQKLVLDSVEGLRDGSISPFTGPIYDQDGEIRIAEGRDRHRRIPAGSGLAGAGSRGPHQLGIIKRRVRRNSCGFPLGSVVKTMRG